MKHMFRITKTRVILIALLAVILIIRAVAPALILSKLNQKLATVSPVYSMHIGGLDIGLFTFSYIFENIDSKYKKTGETFFHLDRVRVQISFSELLHLRILTNVRADRGHFVLTHALFEGAKENKAQTKKDTKDTAHALFPVRVAEVEIHNSSFDFADFVKQDPSTRWRISSIEAKAFNLTPVSENPYASFSVQGQLLDKFPFKAVGKAKPLEKPLGWKVDAEVHDFALPAANPMLLTELPFSFVSGSLDLYSEIRSQDGKIVGYVKPFLKHVKILKLDEHFKSAKHVLFEIAGAFANFMLKNADTKVTATKIAFHTEDGHFKVDTGDAVKEAIKNGYSKPLTPGIDDSVPFK